MNTDVQHTHTHALLSDLSGFAFLPPMLLSVYLKCLLEALDWQLLHVCFICVTMLGYMNTPQARSVHFHHNDENHTI